MLLQPAVTVVLIPSQEEPVEVQLLREREQIRVELEVRLHGRMELVVLQPEQQVEQIWEEMVVQQLSRPGQEELQV
jgi:hypothetical protein